MHYRGPQKDKINPMTLRDLKQTTTFLKQELCHSCLMMCSIRSLEKPQVYIFLHSSNRFSLDISQAYLVTFFGIISKERCNKTQLKINFWIPFPQIPVQGFHEPISKNKKSPSPINISSPFKVTKQLDFLGQNIVFTCFKLVTQLLLEEPMLKTIVQFLSIFLILLFSLNPPTFQKFYTPI